MSLTTHSLMLAIWAVLTALPILVKGHLKSHERLLIWGGMYYLVLAVVMLIFLPALSGGQTLMSPQTFEELKTTRMHESLSNLVSFSWGGLGGGLLAAWISNENYKIDWRWFGKRRS